MSYPKNYCFGCDSVHSYKLDKTNGAFSWIGCSRTDYKNKLNIEFIENKDKLEIWAGVSDPDLSYEFDEMAVVRYKNKWYLCQTGGCSCPASYEVWSVVAGPLTLKGIKDKIKKGQYEGYTLKPNYEIKLLEELDNINVKNNSSI